MGDLKTIKTRREILTDVVAKDLAAAIQEALKRGVTGYVLIIETDDELEMAARVSAPDVRGVIGFIESDVKPTLIGVLKGNGKA